MCFQLNGVVSLQKIYKESEFWGLDTFSSRKLPKLTPKVDRMKFIELLLKRNSIARVCGEFFNSMLIKGIWKSKDKKVDLLVRDGFDDKLNLVLVIPKAGVSLFSEKLSWVKFTKQFWLSL